MQQLRIVAPSDDGTYLTVHSDATGEQFALPIDDALRKALAPAPAAFVPTAFGNAHTSPALTDATGASQGSSTAKAASALSPREIQVRVRAGELPENLAAEAGVSPDRIARFSTAVLQERSRVAGEARRARARRGGPDGELLPFGEVVDARFAAHGIDPMTVLWDAVRESDGPWSVTAQWQVGQTAGSASWLLDLGARLVSADDETAQELLSDRPVPPRATLTVPAAPTAPAAASEHPATDDGMRDNVRQLTRREDDGFFDQDAADGDDDAGSGAQVMPLSSFFAPAGAESPISTASAEIDSFAPTDQIPRIDPAADRAVDRAAEPATSTAPGDDALFPPEPGRIEHDPDNAEQRARIPSWDDILLGVRRKRD